MKKKFMVFAALAVSLFAGSALANGPEISDQAQVISSRPIYQNRNSQECHMESVAGTAQQVGERGMSGSILGGLAGALLGAQVGQGNGRIVAVGAGAVAGAVAGDRLQNNNGNGGGQAQASQQQQVCQQVSRQEVTGYEVRYAYQGREGSTVMQQQPGSTVRVGISVY